VEALVVAATVAAHREQPTQAVVVAVKEQLMLALVALVLLLSDTLALNVAQAAQ
jgi:hypothetical protein